MDKIGVSCNHGKKFFLSVVFKLHFTHWPWRTHFVDLLQDKSGSFWLSPGLNLSYPGILHRAQGRIIFGENLLLPEKV